MSEAISKGGVIVRHDDHIIDEVVARGVDVHLEYLSDKVVWIKIGDVAVTLWMAYKPHHIAAQAESDEAGLTIHPSLTATQHGQGGGE